MSPNCSDAGLFLVHCVDTEGPLAESLDRLTGCEPGHSPDAQPRNAEQDSLGELDLGPQTEAALRHLHSSQLEIQRFLARGSSPCSMKW